MTATNSLDLSKVPHLEERRQLLEQFNPRRAIERERDAAIEPFQVRRRATLKTHTARILAIREELAKAIGARDDELNVIDAEEGPVALAFSQRLEAWDDAFQEALRDDHSWRLGDDEPIEFCTLTGLPLHDDDDVLDDDAFGGRILRAALPFPNAGGQPDDADEAEAA